MTCGDHDGFGPVAEAYPNFTPCFESIFIANIPSIWMLTAGSFRAFSMHKSSHLPVEIDAPTVRQTLRMMVCLALLAIPCVALFRAMVWKKDRHAYLVVQTGLDAAAWVVCILVTIMENRRLLQLGMSTRVFWIVRWVVAVKLLESTLLRIFYVHETARFESFLLVLQFSLCSIMLVYGCLPSRVNYKARLKNSRGAINNNNKQWTTNLLGGGGGGGGDVIIFNGRGGGVYEDEVEDVEDHGPFSMQHLAQYIEQSSYGPEVLSGADVGVTSWIYSHTESDTITGSDHKEKEREKEKGKEKEKGRMLFAITVHLQPQPLLLLGLRNTGASSSSSSSSSTSDIDPWQMWVTWECVYKLHNSLQAVALLRDKQSPLLLPPPEHTSPEQQREMLHNYIQQVMNDEDFHPELYTFLDAHEHVRRARDQAAAAVKAGANANDGGRHRSPVGSPRSPRHTQPAGGSHGGGGGGVGGEGWSPRPREVVVGVAVTGWSRWEENGWSSSTTGGSSSFLAGNSDDTKPIPLAKKAFYTFHIAVTGQRGSQWTVQKMLDDVRALREKMEENFPRAALPALPLREKKWGTGEKGLENTRKLVEIFLQELINAPIFHCPELWEFFASTAEHAAENGGEYGGRADDMDSYGYGYGDEDFFSRSDGHQLSVGGGGGGVGSAGMSAEGFPTSLRSKVGTLQSVRLVEQTVEGKAPDAHHRFLVTIPFWTRADSSDVSRDDNKSPHVVYKLCVREYYEPGKYIEWKLERRYSDFKRLHDQLRKMFADAPIPELPPRRGIGLGVVSTEYLQRRLRGLELYCQQLINTSHFQSDTLLSFFDLNNNHRDLTYGTDFD